MQTPLLPCLLHTTVLMQILGVASVPKTCHCACVLVCVCVRVYVRVYVRACARVSHSNDKGGVVCLWCWVGCRDSGELKE